MTRRMTKDTAAALMAVTLLSAGAASADDYTELIPWATIQGGGASTHVYSHAFDGDTAYFQLSGGSQPRISKVTDIDGTPVQSDLVSASSWIAISGNTTLTAFYGFGRYGSNLQFGDTASDAIWRVDTASGTPSAYVSKATIQTYVGGAPQILSPSTIDLAGEHVFYEGFSDSILRTTGANTLETLTTSAQLTTAFGNSAMSGGMAVDDLGNLYWGNSTSDELHRRTTAGLLEVVLTEAQIQAVTSTADPAFGDVFYAPDGNIYFTETTSDNILSFSPLTPAPALAIHTTKAELTGGPSASNSVSTFGWYNDNLTWTRVSGAGGLYNAVPEPSTTLLMAVGLPAAAILRRRSRGA